MVDQEDDDDQAVPLSLFVMVAMYFPWWNAWSNSRSDGCLDPSPAYVPAP